MRNKSVCKTKSTTWLRKNTIKKGRKKIKNKKTKTKIKVKVIKKLYA